ncbi:MAG: bifunctional 4-hydroxy-2-oxoglutarate aldolase/2-dehydro-3-deoxy-phosphogluconate aldolase [Bacteroidota bacterium]
MKNETLSRILSTKIVAILRGADPDGVMSIIEALHAGGITNVEITLNSPNALELIRKARDVMGDRMLVGAGTVLDPEQARAAIDAGAKFLISPVLDEDTIRYTLGAGVVSIPGAFTPTEILKAHRLGADIVKVFPNPSGPGYIRDIRAPLSHIPLMPTGGIRPDNIRAYMDAGGVAFGIGSALVNSRNPITEEYLLTIRETARAFVQAVSGPSS